MAMGCEITCKFHFSGANIAIRLKFHNIVVQVLCRKPSLTKLVSMRYKVKNLHGTSGRLPQNGNSWLEYWERATGLRASRCHYVGCSTVGRHNLVGAHVKKAGVNDNSWYIVPLCNSCNHVETEFWVEGPLVPVR